MASDDQRSLRELFFNNSVKIENDAIEDIKSLHRKLRSIIQNETVVDKDDLIHYINNVTNQIRKVNGYSNQTKSLLINIVKYVKNKEITTTVVNCRYQDFDVYIGRGKCPKSNTHSIWGNPFGFKPNTNAQIIVASREEAITAYGEWIKQQPHLLSKLCELKGKRLGCWCRPDRCHGDILVELIKEHCK